MGRFKLDKTEGYCIVIKDSDGQPIEIERFEGGDDGLAAYVDQRRFLSKNGIEFEAFDGQVFIVPSVVEIQR